MNTSLRSTLGTAMVLALVLAGSSGCAWIADKFDNDDDVPQSVRTPAGISGVRHVEGKQDVDALLSLTEERETGVLVVDSELDEEGVSDVHLQRLSDWIQAGGVLWAAGDGLESGFVHSIVDFELDDFSFHKSASGKRGGELIVRDATPNLKINEHELTRGVEELYLFPRFSFEGTGSRRMIPLVEMTDSRGKHGTVIAAYELGRGYVVLDGTAREEDELFRDMPGFEKGHPNAEQTAEGWKDYDWTRLYENAVDLAERRLSQSGVYARPEGRGDDDDDDD